MKATTAAPFLPAPIKGTVEAGSRRIRWIGLCGGFLVVIAVFFAFVRPWFLSWGATPEEQGMLLPGDQFAVAEHVETRAITIDASQKRVWPWLAQLGQDRGGFYSYDILENMVGAGMTTSDVLLPAKQSWKAGDKLWMYPPQRHVALTAAPLQTYVPGQAIGFATTPESNWNFVLQPQDGGRTRLLVRGRGPAERSVGALLFNRLLFEPAHFAMEKRMMIGIKQLAEGGDRGRLWNHVQVLLWTVTFGLWVASIVFVLRRTNWVRALVGFGVASFLFQVLTLGQPSVWLSSLLVAGLAWLLWRPAKVKGVQVQVT
jgi:hypothetical protein